MRSTSAFFLVCFSCCALVHAQESEGLNFVTENLSGEQVTLREYLDHGPVFIAFWATWCGPCKLELKALQELHEKYATRGLAILAINRDTPNSLAKVNSFINSQRYTMPVLLDPNEQIFALLNGAVIPFSVMINGKGEIVRRHTGYLPGDESVYEEEIVQVLSENEQR